MQTPPASKLLGQQSKQDEWFEQWSLYQDREGFLFNDWIAPARLEDFRDKTVLECGCGGGQHTAQIAQVARSVTAVDLNCIPIARNFNRQFQNINFVEADIAQMDLLQQFDIVVCIGVIHHTNEPDRTFENIYRHCKPGGLVIIWTYSFEGNFLVRAIVEPARQIFLRRLPRSIVSLISELITAGLYPLVYTIYLVPLFSFLPYFDYFRNFRRLSFRRNVLNVFDKLNAPQTRFTTLAKCRQWFSPQRFELESISIRPYAGVSYSLNGIKGRIHN